ncbi:MAG: magnesium transporter CorA family protein [bacterium]|nr:magnesium transporter CorA family protein [bacterium]
MIECLYVSHEGINEIEVHEISEYLNKDGFLWINIEDLVEDEVAYTVLSNVLKFHELSIEDCAVPQMHSKIEEFENYIFLAIHGVSGLENIFEVDIFIGKNFVVSVYTSDNSYMRNFFLKAKSMSLNFKSIETFIYRLLNHIVSSFTPGIEAVESEISKLQDRMLEAVEKISLKEIFSVKNRLLKYRKILDEERNVFAVLAREIEDMVSKKSGAYIRDLYFMLHRLNSTVDLYNQIITSSLEVYYSSISAKLNLSIKYLTYLATIAIPPLFIASYYGMNVEFYERNYIFKEHTVLWAIFISVFLSYILWLFLKKRKVL